jgi:hypothetical protein
MCDIKRLVEDTWADYAIHGDDDLQKVLPLMKVAMEKRAR